MQNDRPNDESNSFTVLEHTEDDQEIKKFKANLPYYEVSLLHHYTLANALLPNINNYLPTISSCYD